MEVIVKLEEDEKKNEKIYNSLEEAIKKISKEVTGCKITSNLDKDTLLKILILLQNDGIFVDEKNNIVIWDDETAKNYNNQIFSTCRRVCNKKEKGMCPGCAEYLSLAKLNACFIKEELVLNVA